MENTKTNPQESQNIYETFGSYTPGIAAEANAAFLKLAALFSKIANEFGGLFMDQTNFQQTAANSSANATKENAQDTAKATIMEGIGTLISSAAQLGASLWSYKSTSDAMPEDPNLELAKEYQKACQSPHASIGEEEEERELDELNPDGIVAKTTQNPEESESELDERVKELVAIKDIEKELLIDEEGKPKTDPLSNEEKTAVQTMDSRDQVAFKKQIDDYISEKTKARNEAINAAANQTQPKAQILQTFGNALAAPIGKFGSAYYQNEAGKDKALETLASAALSLAQNSAEQERNKADSFQQTASSEFDKLTQIRQAETSSQG